MSWALRLKQTLSLPCVRSFTPVFTAVTRCLVVLKGLSWSDAFDNSGLNQNEDASIQNSAVMKMDVGGAKSCPPFWSQNLPVSLAMRMPPQASSLWYGKKHHTMLIYLHSYIINWLSNSSRNRENSLKGGRCLSAWLISALPSHKRINNVLKLIHS